MGPGTVWWLGRLVLLQARPAHFCLAPAPTDLSQKRGALQIGCLEALVKEGGVDINARDWSDETPLFWLAKFYRADDAAAADADNAEQKDAAARVLSAAGARASSGVFDADGRSPLMVAATYNNARFARLQIEEAGAPADERHPENGRTALHYCCDHDETETMAVLLDAGANKDPQDDSGSTPLLFCVLDGRPAAARLLLERGASTSIAEGNGFTPLLAACRENDSWLCDGGGRQVFKKLLRCSSALTQRARHPSC